MHEKGEVGIALILKIRRYTNFSCGRTHAPYHATTRWWRVADYSAAAGGGCPSCPGGSVRNRLVDNPTTFPFSCALCNKLQRQMASEEVLGTRQGVAAFAKWAPATGLFHPRYGTFGTAGEGEEDGA